MVEGAVCEFAADDLDVGTDFVVAVVVDLNVFNVNPLGATNNIIILYINQTFIIIQEISKFNIVQNQRWNLVIFK